MKKTINYFYDNKKKIAAVFLTLFFLQYALSLLTRDTFGDNSMAEYVYDEKEFKRAMHDSTVNYIEIMADFAFTTSYSATNINGSSIEGCTEWDDGLSGGKTGLFRQLTINGNGHTIDFRGYAFRFDPAAATDFVDLKITDLVMYGRNYYGPFFIYHSGANKSYGQIHYENVKYFGAQLTCSYDSNIIFSERNRVELMPLYKSPILTKGAATWYSTMASGQAILECANVTFEEDSVFVGFCYNSGAINTYTPCSNITLKDRSKVFLTAYQYSEEATSVIEFNTGSLYIEKEAELNIRCAYKNYPWVNFNRSGSGFGIQLGEECVGVSQNQTYSRNGYLCVPDAISFENSGARIELDDGAKLNIDADYDFINAAIYMPTSNCVINVKNNSEINMNLKNMSKQASRAIYTGSNAKINLTDGGALKIYEDNSYVSDLFGGIYLGSKSEVTVGKDAVMDMRLDASRASKEIGPKMPLYFVSGGKIYVNDAKRFNVEVPGAVNSERCKLINGAVLYIKDPQKVTVWNNETWEYSYDETFDWVIDYFEDWTRDIGSPFYTGPIIRSMIVPFEEEIIEDETIAEEETAEEETAEEETTEEETTEEETTEEETTEEETAEEETAEEETAEAETAEESITENNDNIEGETQDKESLYYSELTIPESEETAETESDEAEETDEEEQTDEAEETNEEEQTDESEETDEEEQTDEAEETNEEEQTDEAEETTEEETVEIEPPMLSRFGYNYPTAGFADGDENYICATVESEEIEINNGVKDTDYYEWDILFNVDMSYVNANHCNVGNASSIDPAKAEDFKSKIKAKDFRRLLIEKLPEVTVTLDPLTNDPDADEGHIISGFVTVDANVTVTMGDVKVYEFKAAEIEFSIDMRTLPGYNNDFCFEAGEVITAHAELNFKEAYDSVTVEDVLAPKKPVLYQLYAEDKNFIGGNTNANIKIEIYRLGTDDAEIYAAEGETDENGNFMTDIIYPIFENERYFARAIKENGCVNDSGVVTVGKNTIIIDHVPDFDFGVKPAKFCDAVYYADTDDEVKYVQITDARNFESPWSLTVKLTDNFRIAPDRELSKAFIRITNISAIPVGGLTRRLDYSAGTVIIDENETVVMGINKDNVRGTYRANFGRNGSAKTSVELHVPAESEKILNSEYAAVVTWTLSDVPPNTGGDDADPEAEGDQYEKADTLSGNINFNGSTSMETLVKDLKFEFNKIYPGVAIGITQSDSAGGLIYAKNGLGFGMMSMPYVCAEGDDPLDCIQIAWDGIAIVTDKATYDALGGTISVKELGYIYSGKTVPCPPCSPVRKILLDNLAPIMREDGSGTREFFESVLESETPGFTVDDANIVKKGSTDEIALWVSSATNRIGYMSHGHAGGDLYELSVNRDKRNPVKPTKSKILNGAYPFSRPLLLLHKGDLTGAEREFLKYALSLEGQTAVNAAGFVPLSGEQIKEQLSLFN